MKLTPWFPSEVKPVHVGVYAIHRLDESGRFDYFKKWNGDRWLYGSKDANQAALNEWESVNQIESWRGLAEKP